jgi:hypothetical protein
VHAYGALVRLDELPERIIVKARLLSPLSACPDHVAGDQFIGSR